MSPTTPTASDAPFTLPRGQRSAALVGAFAILLVAPSDTTAQASGGSSQHHHHHHHRKHPGGKKGPGKKPNKDTRNPLPKGPILALGDSVMKGCASALGPALDYRVKVDAVVGRQVRDTIRELYSYRVEHRLPKTVIIQVGNNGPLVPSDLALLRHALRGVQDIVVVNVRNDTAWEAESNQAITAWLRGWKFAHLADWYHHSKSSMFNPDLTHPLPQYCPVYARLIATTLRESVRS